MAVTGYPTAGEQDVAFLDCPEVAMTGIAPPPLHAPISWTLHDSPQAGAIIVMNGTAGVWILDFPGTLTSVTIPQPPSTVNPTELFGTGTLAVTIQALDWAALVDIPRFSVAAPFYVKAQ